MLVLIMVVTGCGSTADIYFDKYGNAIVTYRYYMEDKEYKAAFVNDNLKVYTFDRTAITKDTPYETITQRNGKTYYVYKFMYKEPIGNGYTYLDVDRNGKVGTQELTTIGCLIDTRWKSLSKKRFTSDVFADLTITFKQPIIQSNGVISNKGYTVTWFRKDMLDCDFLYAYSKSYLNSRVPFSYDLYSTKSNLYTEKDTYNALPIMSIIPFKHIYDKGEDILGKGKVIYKDGVYRFKYNYKLGSYSIKAVNKVGSVKYKLMVDYTDPKVSGVYDGGTFQRSVTIRYSDTGSGVKTAILDGQNIKSGTKVKESGKHKLNVYDKAFHVTRITFYIN